MTARRAPSRTRTRGYTAVELLMSIAVLAIGISGIIAMQKITVATNSQSKNLTIATQVAQAWQAQLALDAVLWNYPAGPVATSDLDQTEWLKFVGSGWIRPPFPADVTRRQFGPAFDGLGNPVALPGDLAQAHFCTHIRLSWLRNLSDGNDLIRTEVRVFWLREGMGGPINAGLLCDDVPPENIGNAGERYHFVYLTSAVKQNALAAGT